jgi:uncharacterized protein YcbX
MFDFQAMFVEPPRHPGPLPAARITFRDGASASTDQTDVDTFLSTRVGRNVLLAVSAPDAPRLEGYWPEYEWLEQPGQEFDVEMPPGMFFDGAVVHLVTTATLNRLQRLVPQSRFEVRRFRPNFVIELGGDVEGFVENDWIGRTLLLGEEVLLKITQPCPRCVMTTLSQGNLLKDPDILRTAVQHNQGNVGVYASVSRGGRVRRGDTVELA